MMSSLSKTIRKPRLYFTYYGVTVWRNTEPGSKLRYSALGGLAADTQEGMKKLIREELGK